MKKKTPGYDTFPLQDIVIEIILGGKNSVQGPLLLKLLLLALKQCLHLSQQNALHIVIFTVFPSKFS